jgi:hypothetical protein
MIKKIPWKKGNSPAKDTVIVFKLADGLFTLAQSRGNSLMQFFAVSKQSPDAWQGTDLNTAEPLFCVYVVDYKLKSLVEGISPEGVVPNARPVPANMLSFTMEPDAGGDVQYGADLVELASGQSSTDAKIIRKNLDPVKDLQTIYDHELTGMIGDPEKLRKRLMRFFETGVNWDDQKSFLFKDIPLPPGKPL